MCEYLKNDLLHRHGWRLELKKRLVPFRKLRQNKCMSEHVFRVYTNLCFYSLAMNISISRTKSRIKLELLYICAQSLCQFVYKNTVKISTGIQIPHEFSQTCTQISPNLSNGKQLHIFKTWCFWCREIVPRTLIMCLLLYRSLTRSHVVSPLIWHGGPCRANKLSTQI